MRKLLLLMLIVPMFAMAQSKIQKAKFQQEMDSKYFTVDGDNIVVSRVIDNIHGTKDEIYSRVKSYFARNYTDSKSVIQTDDEKNGLIIGKGVYHKFDSWTNWTLHRWWADAYHILRIDIKDGKARVICSCSEVVPQSSYFFGEDYLYSVTNYSPFNNSWAPCVHNKGTQMEIVLRIVDLMNGSIDGLEKSMKDGGSLKAEKSDW